MDEASGMRGEILYQTRGRGGSSFRGRGRSGANRGGISASREAQVKSESCFRCGEVDHWSRECPKKESVCSWCAVVGHIEKTCYSKANGAARGSKGSDNRGGRGAARGGRGGGYSRYGEGDGNEGADDQGHSEVLMGEVSMGTGDGDGDEREWVCDSGADYHMSGDATLFDLLGTFHRHST